MTNILLCGCYGRMGQVITDCADGEYRIAAGVDILDGNAAYPTFHTLDDVNVRVDVILDFSHHSQTALLLNYAIAHALPVVVAATGQTEDEMQLLKNAAAKIPVFYSRNMSLGVNALCELAASAARILGDGFDVEIIEMHHRNKLDAPSGTALMIEESIKQALPYEAETVYDRTNRREKRPAHEIGISSVRGGGIVGEHEVLFCGSGETLRISHTALGREVFAAGALHACAFLAHCSAGFYTMKEMLKEAGKEAASV